MLKKTEFLHGVVHLTKCMYIDKPVTTFMNYILLDRTKVFSFSISTSSLLYQCLSILLSITGFWGLIMVLFVSSFFLGGISGGLRGPLVTLN
jgi:hypothetical protein